MKLLIIGYKGQLGYDLYHQATLYGFEPLGLDLPECDITRYGAVDRAVNDAGKSDVVINAAAYTAVDAAETDRDAAFAVNRDGASNVARVCREKSLPLIHLSTDYVFDGLKATAYQPSDPVHPLSVYGTSKTQGEHAVRRETDRHVIVRTAWLFGHQGPNFVKTIIRLAKEKTELRIVDDQIGCPTYSADLGAALLKVATMAAHDKPVWGTHHYTNQGAVTWYAFARRIVALAGSRERFKVNEVLPVLSSQISQAAQRPSCTILDCTSFEQTFKVRRRSWVAALKEMIAGLYSEDDTVSF